VFDPDGENIMCLENTVLFLISSFQYILVAVVFSVGPPYRKPLWTNGRLVLTLSILVALTIWCVLFPTDFMMELLELEVVPFDFRLLLLFLACLNLVISLVCEKYVFSRLVVWMGHITKKYQRRSRDGYAAVDKLYGKIYERVMDEMDTL
jgi:cation-transporting ATPase 13A3/4/5